VDANKRYVTQISGKDMKEIAAAANIHAGEGIVVTQTESGLEVSVDLVILQNWIKTVIQGGNIQ